MKQSNVRNINDAKAFLYVRLSRDDELEGESYSISNQKNYSQKLQRIRVIQTLLYSVVTVFRE